MAYSVECSATTGLYFHSCAESHFMETSKLLTAAALRSEDRVVFVTGGAGTICSMQTRALVRLGANACIIGRNVEKTEAAAKDIATARSGAKVIGIGGCDVRKVDSLNDAAMRCAKELGGIDFVIAGAAGNFLVSMQAMSSNAFKSVMDIDVLGTFNTIKATMPYLLKSSDARIICISATFHFTGMPMQGHVAAAKASVDSLMASVALEYGPRGVTSNVISPGAIAETEGALRLVSPDKEALKKYAKSIPAGRLGTVKDIADATVYLFSSAGSWVNGHVLVVDGGSWRRQGAAVVGGHDYEYPDFLLSEGEEAKAKL
ncbi:sporulation protein SPS19 [Moelleriella libera RCEF 2490]|uniref:2,4-dienoyl-CoA reductase [(3E)-enoyl-CoA-producing] n=1 Tax=Moelleriella libera RCEF 2490 TaxID=1081109 RepID=A0A166UMK8_9HYPO|nr:sporulation protein SPS19 [Moelleriella libera RCEF 2490]